MSAGEREERQLPSRTIAEAIRSQIESGELPPGAQLPSERDLASAYGTSGTAVWVHDRPLEPAPPALDRLRPQVQMRAPGKISASVARDPSAEDHASVEAERSTPPLLRVYRLSALREESVRQQLPSVSVVVAEGLPDVRAVRRIFPDATLVRLPAL